MRAVHRTFLLLTLAWPTLVMRQQVQRPEKPPQYSVEVQSRVVQVNAIVTDQQGHPLSWLKEQNFQVFVDGRRQILTNFVLNTGRITIVLLMEFSNVSGPYWARLEPHMARGFASHLGPEDWIALVSYDLKPRILVDFTHNNQEIEEALATEYFPTFSQADEFDALLFTVDRLKDVSGKKAVLLVSSGLNTFSGRTLDQTLTALRETHVTIFTIDVAEMRFGPSLTGRLIPYFQGQNVMNTFARMSGGYAWSPQSESAMPNIFDSVVSFLRNQYSLGFEPPPSTRDGKFHKIHVRVVDDQGRPLDVIVYARQGFEIPKSGITH